MVHAVCQYGDHCVHSLLHCVLFCPFTILNHTDDFYVTSFNAFRFRTIGTDGRRGTVSAKGHTGTVMHHGM